MKPTRLAVACAFAGFFCVRSVAAQHHDHPAAALGDVNFPVSCTPEAQEQIQHGGRAAVLLLLGKIDGAVADVLAADPTCAMAHWVKAVASLDNPLGVTSDAQAGAAGVGGREKAKQLGGKTQRERDYIAAVEVVFKDHETVPFATARGSVREGARADSCPLSRGLRGGDSLCLLAAGDCRSERPDAMRSS